MPSGDGPGGTYMIGGAGQGTFAARIARADAEEVALQDAELGGRLEFATKPPCALATQPLVTVSRSESGFEKIMQGTVVACLWMVSLGPGERAERTITLRCVTTRS
jgi:alpha-amylase